MNFNNDEDFLIMKNDVIDNSAYELCCSLINKYASYDPNTEGIFPWDMQHIAEVTSMVEQYLNEKGFEVCHPFYIEMGGETEVICFKSTERCKYCKKPAIQPFKFINTEN